MTQNAARSDIIGRLKGLAGPRACEEAIALTRTFGYMAHYAPQLAAAAAAVAALPPAHRALFEREIAGFKCAGDQLESGEPATAIRTSDASR